MTTPMKIATVPDSRVEWGYPYGHLVSTTRLVEDKTQKAFNDMSNRPPPLPPHTFSAEAINFIKPFLCWFVSGALTVTGIWCVASSGPDDTTMQNGGISMATIFGCFFCCLSCVGCNALCSKVQSNSDEKKSLLNDA